MPACSGGVACVGMTPVELEDSDSDVTEEEKVTVKVGRDLKFHYPALFSYKCYIEVRKKYCFDDRSTVYKHPTKKLESRCSWQSCVKTTEEHKFKCGRGVSQAFRRAQIQPLQQEHQAVQGALSDMQSMGRACQNDF